MHHMQVVDKSTTAHERHDFGDAGHLLYDFFWGEFADWYIEAAKARLYGQDPQAALQTRQVRHLLYTAFPHSQDLTAHLTSAQTWPCLHLVKGWAWAFLPMSAYVLCFNVFQEGETGHALCLTGAPCASHTFLTRPY